MESIMERVNINTHTGCHLWTGKIDVYGYGKILVNWKDVLVHRYLYEEKFGPIRSGLLACHKCDVRNCVNPDHIFIGTHADNSLDMRNKGRSRGTPGESHRKAKLTNADVIAIRNDKSTPTLIAAFYGVTTPTICNIRAERTWRHLL